ncbi:23S rRNA (cytidine(2498)-2'-O)-methyltransferase RlmM [Alkalimonas amylolytica]|uniref:Ribosomal RNA large subunit methyltransferase M n=1 Tax=Alkalimonas amylolytica TaxID=152573 RepID=A0A1H3WXM2_ALKAM|nr:23S rRNA (cytidine(2498)-2'-O)-methyltransferase RlmM [Alkalimonas amylolytica]SDZ91730.1 23S rRNA (cytidine2498-2'-O)-methyltransferase [Alkalimonas amylolytica]
MKQLLLYCRSGFEKDCAAEIQDKAAQHEVFGYCKLSNHSAYVIFEAYDGEALVHFFRTFALSQLVFARQWVLLLEPLLELQPHDRVSTVLDTTASHDVQGCGQLRVEYPETNDGKTLSTLARKLTVPLRLALRNQGTLTAKERDDKPVLHLFLLSGSEAMLGLSYPKNNSPLENGIMRLKSPKDAPSRSTLKLEEAFLTFIPASERPQRLAPGLNAVDLGASPGGWTYQLVRRSMMVTAIDNGPMDPALMESGQVKHLQVDGFKFQPAKQNVYWLVCDMIEKPDRVAVLICDWFSNGWCQESIFNLKLPMKKRYEMVEQVLEQIHTRLHEAGVRYQLQAKHLYHDREEVTVHIQRKS